MSEKFCPKVIIESLFGGGKHIVITGQEGPRRDVITSPMERELATKTKPHAVDTATDDATNSRRHGFLRHFRR